MLGDQMRGLEHHLSEMAETHRTLSGERQPAVGGWLGSYSTTKLLNSSSHNGKVRNALFWHLYASWWCCAPLLCVAPHAQIASKSTAPRRQWECSCADEDMLYLPSPSPPPALSRCICMQRWKYTSGIIWGSSDRNTQSQPFKNGRNLQNGSHNRADMLKFLQRIIGHPRHLQKHV